MFVRPSDAVTKIRGNSRTKSSSRVETGGRKIGNSTAGDVCVDPAITFLGLVPGVCRWIAADASATAAAFGPPATAAAVGPLATAAAFVFGDTKAAKTVEGTKATKGTKGTKGIKGAQAIETAEAAQDVVLVHQA